MSQQYASNPAAGIPNEQIVALCREKAAMAEQFCTGPSTELPQAKPQCDLWRQYCANNPAVSPTANSNPDIAELCARYAYTADQYCPGCELIQLRQYCNYYRIYCSHKPAFPSVDGNIGVVTSSFDLAGIPYYPFNPQGAITTSDKTNIGFGNWGADVSRQRGVSDFYEQTEQVDANWQRGTFGGGTKFNVPIVGIGAYDTKDVSLGCIANPADLAGMLSGGVPQGLPLSGLGQIPLSQGLPIEPMSPALQQQSELSKPIDLGGLGTLGALTRGAPLGSGPIGPLQQYAGDAIPFG